MSDMVPNPAEYNAVPTQKSRNGIIAKLDDCFSIGDNLVIDGFSEKSKPSAIGFSQN
jgi:hypothetical protein